MSGHKALESYEEKLPAPDQGLVIANAMAGNWEYGVYLLGLPVGLKARVEVQWDGRQVVATSQVDHFLAANNHQSVFSLASCDYRLHSYQNSGFSPGWRFDDAVAFDWLKKQIHYQGLTQGPKTPDAQPQTVTLPLDDAIYVDKLSQFAALACALGKNGKSTQSSTHLSTQFSTKPNTKQSVPLSYVDDTIGRYRFSVAQATTQMSVAGQIITVIKVESEPYEYVQGSVHRRVSYWLAPSLGYLPVKISTKLSGMKLTVKMLKTSGPLPGQL
ncbi:hypothetical protein N9Y23_10505 [Pseudomonadales bacterium]|nr:hypothetical protein [Pseudomonadales bacterium]